jgi:hypothetical protein
MQQQELLIVVVVGVVDQHLLQFHILAERVDLV